MKNYFDAENTDLACERRRADVRIDGVEYTKEECGLGVWERISISSEEGARSMGRPCGLYDTLTLSRMDMLDFEELMDAKEELAGGICRILGDSDVTASKVLVAGLGNAELTPDAIGPEVADRVYPTMNIYRMDEELFEGLGCSKVAVIKTGVPMQSGLESAEIVKGICEVMKPDLIVAVDSLKARGRERLGSTIQISTTGISAGSGLRGAGSEISAATMGTDVISIGVPTVIDSSAFVPSECKGRVSEIYEGLIVSPKEVGNIVKNAAEIIGGAINLVFGIGG